MPIYWSWGRTWIVASLLLWTPTVRAADPATQTSRVRLRYHVEGEWTSCPSEAALRNAVSARLGYSPWDETADKGISVSLETVRDSWGAQIVMTGDDGRVLGKRRLSSTSGDCRELASAVELAIAIAIDPVNPHVAAPPRDPAPEPEAGTGEAASAPVPPSPVDVLDPPAPTPPPPPPPPLKPQRERPELRALVGGQLALGAAPAPAGGLHAGLDLTWTHFTLAAEGRADFPAYEDVPGGRISAYLLVGELAPCARFSWLRLCAVAAAGGLRAAGLGLEDASQHTVPFVGGGLRLGLHVPLGAWLGIRLVGDLLATGVRNTLRNSETKEAYWTAPPLSGALGLALELRLL